MRERGERDFPYAIKGNPKEREKRETSLMISRETLRRERERERRGAMAHGQGWRGSFLS